MKEHKFPFESFIGGWYIDEKICDGILDIYKINSKFALPGITGGIVNAEIKDSKDISISYDDFIEPFGQYRKSLQDCLLKYIKKYNHLNEMDCFDITTNYNVQYYKPNGGFKEWHFEDGSYRNRVSILVFMTYLNNVNDGGTEFFYQKVKIKPQKGLTLIFPTDWVFTHRGNTSNTEVKYIVTGWVNIAFDQIDDMNAQKDNNV
jgi:hypothetical protein